MESLQRLLEEHDFLTGLSADQAASLVSCVKNVRLEPGEFLMREGEEASLFYLLRHGRVALEVHVPGRGPIVMESLGQGDMLGLSWLFPPHRVHLDARAIEPVVALAFDGTCLRGKMEADHDLGFALSRRLLAETYKRLQRVRLQRLDVYTGA
jgi:CRP/FNR family transcriptional regulator, cyclic AMP receptor protein